MKKTTRDAIQRLINAVRNPGHCDVEGHDQPCGCEEAAAADVVSWVLDGKFGYEDPVTMYTPGDPFPTSITLPLRLNSDSEITCLVCKSKRLCELSVEVHYPGCTQWYGIHVECIPIAERYDPKNPPKRRKRIIRVDDESAGVMYFRDLKAFEDDCKERGSDVGSDYKLLIQRLRDGDDFADATTEYKWVEVSE